MRRDSGSAARFRRRVALRLLRAALLLSGVPAIALAVAADWLRSGGSRGFGGSQVVLLAVGLALVASSFALRARAVRQLLLPIVRHPWKTAWLVIFSAAVSAGAMEAGLALLGHRPQYTDPSAARLSLARWWRCDDLGCRFDPRHIRDAPPAEELAGRPKAKVFFERLAIVNSQGFHDTQDFVATEELGDSLRILVLGDSFAFGFYAPPGQGWVEVLEEELGRDGPVTLWNTGIPGAATVQQAAVLERLLPVLRPDLVILAFYPGNDVDGNLYPAGGYYASDTGSLIAKYKIGPGLESIEMTPADAYLRATGVRPRGDAGAVEATLGRTRLGTLLLKRWARLRPDVEWLWSPAARATPGGEAKRRRAAARTRQLLAEIEASAEHSGARLLLLLIPGPHDLTQSGQRYRSGKSLVDDLALDTVEVADRLLPEDYLRGDEHWNAAGHAKVGRRMAEAVRSLRD